MKIEQKQPHLINEVLLRMIMMTWNRNSTGQREKAFLLTEYNFRTPRRMIMRFIELIMMLENIWTNF